ncbi:hypothetical protein EC912_102727 [Luteibacter rhizovicinus]|uniref:DUF2306 domain-containing protein n=1 Tax=Luteibacter rhizovicinus TaxID=242606 RepID=A0A4R3YVB0_9GAMM|nr:hypothetical protein [Luteibacter rhizovicinus]TCV96376.1 hypothetical protein EC912_102727 [Luteibacter rhizovicinus]
MSTGLAALTAIHTLISFVAILLGIGAIASLIGKPRAVGWTTWFLAFAVATSVTGFFFPYHGFTPAIGVGIVALIVLAGVYVAMRVANRGGFWCWVYAGGIVASEYFLVFVLVAQAFAKVPALHAAAPTQQEPPFAVAQLVTLLVFVVLGVMAGRRSRRLA